MKIDKGVPLPDRIAKRVTVGPLPLADLGIGDSFLVECTPEELERVLHSVRVRLSRFKQLNKGYNFSSTKDKKGIRVWRV